MAADADTCSMVVLQLMIEKKVITAEQMRAMIEELDTYGSRGLGPRIVARAWVDPAFKARLLKDGNSAAAELGMEADGWPANGGVTGALLRSCQGPASDLPSLRTSDWFFFLIA